MDLAIINGDLFDATEQYICHQCNSVTTVGANLAQSMFKRFPHADIYSCRKKPHIPEDFELPGNIIIRGDGKTQRYVINIIGQYYPGPSKYPNSSRDGWSVRQAAFQTCLDKIAKIPGLKSVAFPWKIGCGAAGGDWIVYRKMIKTFAEKTGVKVRVYKVGD
jgi:O-acetyl-ADP-ribose deacetylase (regulator of RNase III)